MANVAAYSGIRRPNTANALVAVKLVKRIIQAAVAEVTAGCTPKASIRGPLTIPPPNPNIPAIKPEIALSRGKIMVDLASQ